MNTTTVSKPQERQFDIMREASGFDGNRVADSLLAHRDLWRGVIIDRAAYFTMGAYQEHKCDPIDDIRLRDISEGYWNVDTIYIEVAGNEHEDALIALAKTWGADVIDWQAFPNVQHPVLCVWFD